VDQTWSHRLHLHQLELIAIGFTRLEVRSLTFTKLHLRQAWTRSISIIELALMAIVFTDNRSCRLDRLAVLWNQSESGGLPRLVGVVVFGLVELE
jgi:hypothetical protein